MIHNVLRKCTCAESNCFILTWLEGRNHPEEVAGDLTDCGAVHRASKQREMLNRVLEAGTISMRRKNCYTKGVIAVEEARQKT